MGRSSSQSRSRREEWSREPHFTSLHSIGIPLLSHNTHIIIVQPSLTLQADVYIVALVCIIYTSSHNLVHSTTCLTSLPTLRCSHLGPSNTSWSLA